jgi:hypothetical protein
MSDVQNNLLRASERRSAHDGAAVPRIATAPYNKEARTGSGGECPLPNNQGGLGDLAHDTMEASRAVEIVLNDPAALVTPYPRSSEVHSGSNRSSDDSSSYEAFLKSSLNSKKNLL